MQILRQKVKHQLFLKIKHKIQISNNIKKVNINILVNKTNFKTKIIKKSKNIMTTLMKILIINN